MAAYANISINTLIYSVDQANWTVAVAVHYSNECNDGSIPKPNASDC